MPVTTYQKLKLPNLPYLSVPYLVDAPSHGRPGSNNCKRMYIGDCQATRAAQHPVLCSAVASSTRLDGMSSPGSCEEAEDVAAGRLPTASDIHSASAALLEIDTRGTLLRGLRKSTEAAARHRAPGVSTLQRAPRAWDGLTRVHLQVALSSSLVGDVHHGGAQSPAAPPPVHFLPTKRRLSAAP